MRAAKAPAPSRCSQCCLEQGKATPGVPSGRNTPSESPASPNARLCRPTMLARAAGEAGLATGERDGPAATNLLPPPPLLPPPARRRSPAIDLCCAPFLPFRRLTTAGSGLPDRGRIDRRPAGQQAGLFVRRFVRPAAVRRPRCGAAGSCGMPCAFRLPLDASCAASLHLTLLTYDHPLMRPHFSPPTLAPAPQACARRGGSSPPPSSSRRCCTTA